MKRWIKAHFAGPGGIAMLLEIAVPMIVSNAAETLMMFVDRMFLARLGREHLSAAMTGGLTAFTIMTFFLGLIGYVNALVAQYYGARRPALCPVAAAQGMIVALLSYPLLVLVIPFGCWLLRSAGHDALQQELETAYFSILVWGSVMGLLRSALSGFFCGIGRTRVVMLANLAAMFVNVGANYILIFGHLGVPALGIRGAAYGTLIGSTVGTGILIRAYFAAKPRREFGTVRALRFDRVVFSRLLRFGFPSGVELLLNLAAFNVFVQLFHSYGKDAAAAITITFNWDLMAFLPLLGMNMAVMSLVGRYMGAGQPETAVRATFSGLKSAGLYAIGMAFLFLVFPEPLVAVFVHGPRSGEYANVIPLAVVTLRLAAIYTVADAVVIVFDGALRGAGDTRWTMKVSVTLHWLMATASVVLIKLLRVPPAVAWVAFVLLVLTIGLSFYLRFVGGKWRAIQVIGPPPCPVAPLAGAAAAGPPDAV